ncbi:MAG: 4-oxalocrotonate tautomerase [Oxalobacter sp.]|nr:4-oxalocrotonate tautomerase [Oxalobacter sp.]
MKHLIHHHLKQRYTLLKTQRSIDWFAKTQRKQNNPLTQCFPNPQHDRSQHMPTINIQLFEGRTIEQKRELAKAITEATVNTLKCSPSAVDIIMTDVKKENWATAGKLWSDQ